jgi:hypothetical protein
MNCYLGAGDDGGEHKTGDWGTNPSTAMRGKELGVASVIRKFNFECLYQYWKKFLKS